MGPQLLTQPMVIPTPTSCCGIDPRGRVMRGGNLTARSPKTSARRGEGVVMTLPANQVVATFINIAQATGPQDPLTIAAYVANTILRMLLFPIMLLIPIVTLVLGLLVSISFGILLLPLSIIWMPFCGVLLGTSWLWIRAWYLRPFLLVPGVFIALLANVYVSFVPDMGEKYQKVLKLALCDSWPYSYLVFEESRNFDSSSMA